VRTTAAAWVWVPHQATIFGGLSPLDLVTAGAQDGLVTVRRFLDAARSGHYMTPNEIDVGFRPYTGTEIVLRERCIRGRAGPCRSSHSDSGTVSVHQPIRHSGHCS
jgi:hypothetical protein